MWSVSGKAMQNMVQYLKPYCSLASQYLTGLKVTGTECSFQLEILGISVTPCIGFYTIFISHKCRKI